MKKIINSVFSLSMIVLVSAGITYTAEAQNKKDEKTNVKQPPRLLVLDNSQNYSLQNSSKLFQDVLNPSKNTTFTQISQQQDNLGFTHQKLQQYYKGLKVEFGTVVLHSKNGKVETLSNEYYEIPEIDVAPSISNTQALNRATSQIGAQNYMWEYPAEAALMDNYKRPVGELVILPDFASNDNIERLSNFKLAYKFDIYATNPISRGNMYIDAKTGQPLFYDAIIKHATHFGFEGKTIATVETEADFCNRTDAETAFTVAAGTAATRYSGSRTIETRIVGSTFALRDNTRGSGVNTYNSGRSNSYPQTNFTDADNNWSAAEFNNSNKDNAALDAHWGAEVTYDYFSQKHNRNSYNGSGAAINSYVHFDDQPGGAGYDNAFWNGSVMTYGDGSSNGNEGNGFFDALTSLDVASHEIGHAITSSTANLAYQRESGGLNEGFSDIWGAAVEHFAKGNGSDTNPSAIVWLIGDEIDRRSGSAALRSMSNPTALGQPDTYGGQFWKNPNCGTPTQSNDYCGVHTNSGVLNHWFYRTVVGGSGTNDIGNAFNVAGIGMTKAANISYRTLTVYLSANSTFANARTGSIQAAKDLYGAGGAEEQAVTNAWHAVGVGAAYAGGGGGSDYCASAGQSVSDEYISRVQLNTINNTSGAQGYSDFTSVSTSLSEGTAYTVTVTPTWTGSTYAEGYAVWIDYNNDKDFNDAGELVWSKAASTNTPNSGSFTVPSGTAGTATRMRVSMKYNGVPTSCETFQYGEVEDYTVNLSGAAADTQAPTVPASLSTSNVTNTTLTLNWNASTDNVGVTGYDVYQGATVLGTVTATSANVTGLTAATAYQFRVRAKDAAGNVSGYSNTVNVTTTGGGGGNGCANGITSFPYSESFESGLGAWAQSTTDDINWTRDSGGTPSGSTGPSSGAQGSWYMYVEASSPNYPSKRAILNSPCFNLSATNTAFFNFSYHMYGANDMGSIALEISTNNGGSWTSIWSKTGNQGNSWKDENINISAYTGSSVQLRFNRLTGTTWQADIAVDAISVTTQAQSNDICAGVPEWNSSTGYQTGDLVTYQGNLFERTSSSWANIGACGAGNFTITGGNPILPPSGAKLSVYPNPVSGNILNVKLLGVAATDYTIHNLVGQLIGKGSFTESVDVSTLQSGVYFIKVNTGSEEFVQRFIKE